MLSHLGWVPATEQTAAWGGKGLVLLTTPRSYSVSEGSQGRSPGRDLEGSVQAECCSLARSSGFARLLSCSTEDQPSRVLQPLTTAKHQENASQPGLQANLMVSPSKKVWNLPRNIQFLQRFIILYMIPKEHQGMVRWLSAQLIY